MTEERPRPSPYVIDDSAEPQPQLEQTARAVAIAAVLAQLRSLDPSGIFAFYEELMAFAVPDEACPEMSTPSEDGTSIMWMAAGCTTSSNATFFGTATFTRQLGVDDGAGGLIDNTQLDSGIFNITLPDGRTLDAGYGTFMSSVYRAPDYTAYTLNLSGTLEGLGGGADAHPMMNGSLRASSLYATATQTPSTGARSMTLDAIVSGDVAAIAVTGLVATNEAAAPDACIAEPVGSAISLRSDEDQWYDVLFDVPPQDGSALDLALCDGCGATWFRGQNVGPTCLQNEQSPASILLSWENSPW